jgi:hypothetical protein
MPPLSINRVTSINRVGVVKKYSLMWMTTFIIKNVVGRSKGGPVVIWLESGNDFMEEVVISIRKGNFPHF